MPGPGGGFSARTVVRATAALVAALSVAVGTALGVTVTQVVAAQSSLEDELNPARVELGQVLALYVDQETGQRGYILTGDPAFLMPYAEAGARIEQNLALLADQSSPEVRDELAAMTRAHEAWLRSAERELGAVRRGERDRAVELVANGSGKRLFDELRRAHAAAEAQIADDQADATARVDDLLARLALLLGLTVVAFLVTTLLGVAAFNRGVLRPLAVLGSTSRDVAGGRLDRVVAVRGPREVERVAADVDTMRVHLLDELDASRRAAEALELREPAVAALQSALVPQPLHRPGLHVAAEIASAEGVLAGDFIDVVQVGPDRVGLVLGDVSGHGPAAALTGLRLKIALATVLGRDDLATVLPAARGLLAEEPETFVTLFVGVVDLAAGTLAYVNAGHPPPLLGDTPLEPTGPLVSGVLDDASWSVETQPFVTGDRLVAYSDGVLEARTADGREFGADGVADALRRSEGLGGEEVVRTLRAAVRDHEPHPRDDVTILVVTAAGEAS